MVKCKNISIITTYELLLLMEHIQVWLFCVMLLAWILCLFKLTLLNYHELNNTTIKLK